jgi:hypothetical protein
MRPGGWIEMQDFDFPWRCVDNTMKGTNFEHWVQALNKGITALGKDFGRAPRYKEYLLECGFVDVKERRLAWPIGSWARGKKLKMMGAWCKENMLAGIQGWSMAVLTRGLGMTRNEVELLLMGVRSDINSRKLHIYVPL